MNKGRNPLLLLRCCHAESKWCNRRLKLYEQLQLYDISDSVIKPLDEETCVALVNVQGLTPLKMLYGGVDTLFSVLPRGVLIKRSSRATSRLFFHRGVSEGAKGLSPRSLHRKFCS
jgi:hypothetical protein